MRYDIPKIKNEIRLLSRALRENNAIFKQAQREKRESWGLAPSDGLQKDLETVFSARELRQFRSPHSGYWLWGAVSIYFTRLVTLRASMRGKLHFSPNTKTETLENLGLESISLEDQREWAECIADRFEREESEESGVRVAG